MFFYIILRWISCLASDHEDLPEAGVDDDLYFLYGGDIDSPGLCSMDDYWIHDGIEEHNLGVPVDANFAGSTDALKLMEIYSCFTDAVSEICVRSSLVF
ncbi:hypothetical protein DPMN_192668 [Dreissena polymorpha]|uniref:Uncharacterized protein n=1 Tax=Dreissena polymorpha TaxID=45954 RepID=A0A9D3Y7C0_DREPO|nr:hypothetical protein DPMN_192668 [Dreissena polymorpha]